MISTENRKLFHGDRVNQTLDEWGAWRAYFARLGASVKVANMDRRGFAMVPAQWPHLFELLGRADVDFDAGRAFRREYQARKDRERDFGSLAYRQAVVAAAKAKMWRG